jgi:hypothetical protein
MYTIALTDETAPSSQHSNVRSVVSRSRPQSSALMIRRPPPAMVNAWSPELLVDSMQ